MNTLWLPLLLGSVVWAEDQYFPQLTNATWDEARLHCNSCFRDLTTVTSKNVHLIVQNLSFPGHWVGLRRNDSFQWLEWSAWSNGDPVTYQNWYPGHPVPNKEKELIPICPSTTESPMSTPIMNTTSTPMTSLETSTLTSAPVTSLKTSTMWSTKEEEEEEEAEDTCPILNEMLDCLNMTCYDLESVMATCNRTTVTPKTTTYNTMPEVTTFSTTFSTPTTEDTTTEHLTTEDITTESPTTERTTTSNCIFEPKPDPEQYIKDACVVLLMFGMWKEEDCNTSLPYICYEERFFGQINVFDKNTTSAYLNWTAAPGAENYTVEITGDRNFTFNQTDLLKNMTNLTPGTKYSVQVFPVKCGRDLNPQNISFYTKPADVQNLTIVSVTNVSALLEWSKPEGNLEFYSVTFGNDSKPKKCESEICYITDLNPGTEYTFTVKAVVDDTFGGVESSVSNYTMPSPVGNLTSANNDSTSITVTWEAPYGNHLEYHYCFQQVNNSLPCPNCIDIRTKCTHTINESFIERDDIRDGRKYCVCVAAVAENNLSGKMVQIPAYTLPNKVTLTLTSPNSTTIDASWNLEGLYESFDVKISTTAYNHFKPYYNITVRNYTFTGLKAGVCYTVSVITRNGVLNSKAAEEEACTSPAKPTDVTATVNKTTIVLSWKPPAESEGANINYTVTYNNSFWNEYNSTITNETNLIYHDLRPGTRYDFYVSAVIRGTMSNSSTNHAKTEPVKRTLTLMMLCSSVTSLQCNESTTQNELFKKLTDSFRGKFGDMVHWNLSWIKKDP